MMYYPAVRDEPLSPTEAKRLIRQCLTAGGRVDFSGHALDELQKDQMTTGDCLNVLRGGVVEPAEWERGSWRYRVRTARMCVVVSFVSETRLRVVTAWRMRR